LASDKNPRPSPSDSLWSLSGALKPLALLSSAGICSPLRSDIPKKNIFEKKKKEKKEKREKEKRNGWM
jgi:hypothetical protein